MGKYAFSTSSSLIFALNHSGYNSVECRTDSKRILALNGLPNRKRPWFEDVATADAIVIDHVRFEKNLNQLRFSWLGL
jgi:hypothetical protein